MPRSGNIGVNIMNDGSQATGIVDLSAYTGALIGTASDKDAAIAFNTPFNINDTNLALLGATGSLPDAVADYFSQRGESGVQGPLLVVVVDEGVDEAGTLANVAGVEANLTGVWSLINALTLTGLQPGLIAAPGWTHQRAGAKNPVAAAMEQVCARLEAHGFIDLPNTAVQADLLTYIGDFDTRWLSAWYEFIRITRGAGEVIRPPSGFLTGLMSTLEIERGIHISPLNKPIRVAHGITQPMNHGYDNSIATILGNNAINCIVRGRSGLRAWGDETTATSDEQFLSLAISRTIADISRELKTYLTDKWLGEPLNDALFRGVVQDGTRYLDTRANAGEISEARFAVNSILQTPEATLQRKAFFKLDIVPAGPARNITVARRVVARIEVPIDVQI